MGRPRGRTPERIESESVMSEARTMLTLWRRGIDIRDVLQTSATTRADLEAFCARYPEDAAEIQYALWFRDQVADATAKLISRARVQTPTPLPVSSISIAPSAEAQL